MTPLPAPAPTPPALADAIRAAEHTLRQAYQVRHPTPAEIADRDRLSAALMAARQLAEMRVQP